VVRTALVSVTIDLVAATGIPNSNSTSSRDFSLLRWKNPPPFTDDELLEMFALNDGCSSRSTATAR